MSDTRTRRCPRCCQVAVSWDARSLAWLCYGSGCRWHSRHDPEDPALAVLASMKQHVNSLIEAQPCCCEVNAQGLAKCQRCILLGT